MLKPLEHHSDPVGTGQESKVTRHQSDNNQHSLSSAEKTPLCSKKASVNLKGLRSRGSISQAVGAAGFCPAYPHSWSLLAFVLWKAQTLHQPGKNQFPSEDNPHYSWRRRKWKILQPEAVMLLHPAGVQTGRTIKEPNLRRWWFLTQMMCLWVSLLVRFKQDRGQGSWLSTPSGALHPTCAKFVEGAATSSWYLFCWWRMSFNLFTYREGSGLNKQWEFVCSIFSVMNINIWFLFAPQFSFLVVFKIIYFKASTLEWVVLGSCAGQQTGTDGSSCN